MRDWHKEVPPGTMLCRKADRMLALVISVRVVQYPASPGSWHQVHTLLLTTRGELMEDNREVGVFYDHWMKVLT